MLKSLRIRNLVLIESLDLGFEPGFTALTGETGAGKSILLGALQLILGGKARADLVRQDADKLRVEAVFDTPPGREFSAVLQRLEIDGDSESSGELIIEREVTAQGKSRCRVNGHVVTLAALEEIGSHLADLHGQHAQQGLLRSATHLAYLDAFAGLDTLADGYHRRYLSWREAEGKLREAEAEARRVKEQLEFIQFQVRELEKAGLSLGEEESIEAELKLQSGHEKVAQGLAATLSLLEGEQGDVLGRLAKLHKELQSLARYLDPNPFAAQLESVESARQGLSDLRAGLRNYRLPDSADPGKLDALNAKLALIQRLKAKYGVDLTGLIALRERRKRELALVENAEMATAGLKESRDAALAAARQVAAELTEKRRDAARAFEQAVHAHLRGLSMESARFEARITAEAPLADGGTGLQARGAESLEFFLAPNAGEAMKPMTAIASGGEISRVMLALKAALAEGDTRPLLVFDELDTGIGGVTAHKVGQLLKELAKHHQLLVITHLHQVAAQADHQQQVRKTLEGGRTITQVVALSQKERVAELARMLGDEGSKAALKHAKELLAQGAG
jgi:DNA repair protein RecN (Recombination protein N)